MIFIDGFNARLGFQELVIISLLVGVLVTISAGAFKFLFLPSITYATGAK